MAGFEGRVMADEHTWPEKARFDAGNIINRHVPDLTVSQKYALIGDLLDAAAPAIQAAEREDCAKLASETAARWTKDRHFGSATGHFANAAQVLAGILLKN